MGTYANNMSEVLEIEQNGVKYVRDFKNLLINVQRLRGIMNYLATLDEEEEKVEFKKFKSEALTLVSQIRERVSKIKKLIEDDDDSFDIQSSFGRFSSELNEFNTDIMSLRHNYLERYSKFTKDIINFFVKVAENSYLLADMEQKNVILIDLTIEVLPTLLEYVGKLRSIGVQIIEKKVKNLYDSTQLELYKNMIKNTLKEFDFQINSFLEYEKDISTKDKIKTAKNNITKEINHFIDVVTKEIQYQDIIFYEKKHFYELAEDILIVDNAVYSVLFQALEENLTKNKRQFKMRAVKQNILATGVALSIFLGLSFSIYKLVHYI
jgi:hypothetical protein